jgi:transcription elongation factor GreA
MNYKEKLRQLKENEDWQQLLLESLSLYESGNEDRYIIRMIVHAYEGLGKEEELIPFWEILAREEHHSEEFTRKLIDHYKQVDDQDGWLLWSRRLLSHSLRKKEYEGVEDIWIRLVEARQLEHDFAMEIADRLIGQEETERASTLLDLYLLSLEESPEQALAVAKRMLALEPENQDLRKRTEGFCRELHAHCTMVEQFLEKINIRKSEDVLKALEYFEQLVMLCPGNYVLHKSWGVGKVNSVDLLFGKVFVDFPSNPNHAIEIDHGLAILEPLARNDFMVLKIKNPSQLKHMAQENPAALIKLMLKESEILTQKRVKMLLEGIVADTEWSLFISRVKKMAKTAGIQVTGKGSTYTFALGGEKEETPPTLSSIASMKSSARRTIALLRFAEDGLSLSEIEEWTPLVDAQLSSKELTAREKTELLIAHQEITGDTSYFKKTLDAILHDLSTEEKRALVENISKKKHRKQLLTHMGAADSVLVRSIFLQTNDDWLRTQALDILRKKEDTGNLVLEAMGNPYKYPLCFLYANELIMKESETATQIEKPTIVFEVLLELMVQEEAGQKVKARAKTIFSKYGFDLYRATLETSSKEEIAVLLGMVRKHPLIESAEKITFEKLAESKHPSLREKPRESFFYATKDAIRRKQKELDHLVKVEIPANSAEIGKAARQGDLSENFDYISAKEKQRKLIDRVSILKNELSQVQPIEDVAFTEGEAAVGTQITVRSKETGAVREITILGPWDAIPEQHIISHTAPLAQEILGKKVGDTFFDSFHKENLEILKIIKYVRNQ